MKILWLAFKLSILRWRLGLQKELLDQWRRDYHDVTYTMSARINEMEGRIRELERTLR